MYSASNPANVRLEVVHFLKCDLKDVLILVAAIVLSGVIAVFNWKPALLVLGLGVAVVIVSIWQARSMFQVGDVCAAMVIDPQRNLVAVATDLSKSNKPHLVVKVLKQPLSRVTGGPFEQDTRLAFVAMYNGFEHEPRWRDFGGYLINSGTTNAKALKRTLRSISDEQWENLESAVAELEKPYRPGLYDV
jgi:hypothetical protein